MSKQHASITGSSPTSSLSSNYFPPVHKLLLDRPKVQGEGPQLMRVATDGTQFALRQTLCDPSREPLPLARVHRFNCCRQVPSRASHVSLCPAEDAEWHLVLYAYAGSGSTYDAFRCMLVSRDMDVRLVVAKFVAERSCERSGSLDAIEREAQLYNTALMPLQGNHVPLFYGVFKITPPPERTYDDSAFYVMILEDCGWQATPENEHWSFAFMSEDDKTALRTVVGAVHHCGVLHNDIEPHNVMRRMPPTQGAADAKAGDLCLIDFGEARLGTEQELAQERTALEYALDRRVRPRFGTDNQ